MCQYNPDQAGEDDRGEQDREQRLRPAARPARRGRRPRRARSARAEQQPRGGVDDLLRHVRRRDERPGEVDVRPPGRPGSAVAPFDQLPRWCSAVHSDHGSAEATTAAPATATASAPRRDRLSTSSATPERNRVDRPLLLRRHGGRTGNSATSTRSAQPRPRSQSSAETPASATKQPSGTSASAEAVWIAKAGATTRTGSRHHSTTGRTQVAEQVDERGDGPGGQAPGTGGGWPRCRSRRRGSRSPRARARGSDSWRSPSRGRRSGRARRAGRCPSPLPSRGSTSRTPRAAGARRRRRAARGARRRGRRRAARRAAVSAGRSTAAGRRAAPGSAGSAADVEDLPRPEARSPRRRDGSARARRRPPGR